MDIDADTVAALRVHRATRGSLMHELVRDAALVLGNLGGTHRHPERFSRRFAGQVAQARTALGGETPGDPAAPPAPPCCSPTACR
ncbi:hypothetical protein [Geodermatophilus poikilotrophus]|uniref:hypothetical protein n=1 Tax=Geodermatophilus poikilotrophus TaxID=1333667 RepID=UPI0011144570|nr:hypothetical protein [Geodermatophilus poikilotrophus]